MPRIRKPKSATPTKRRPRRNPPRSRRATVRMLFTCVGRRVQLLAAFRNAAAKLGIELEIHGADASVLSPAIHLTDRPHLVPPIAADSYIDTLLGIVRTHRITLLAPLLDFELPLLAAARDRFAEAGCCVLISTEQVVRTCWDKLETFRVLRDAGIDTPQTWTWEEALRLAQHRFPYFMKPRHGSAAVGNYVVHNAGELDTFGRRVKEPIVQEFVDGSEHTLDVYCGLDGKPRCAVPRRRLEVRNGEVSKGVIAKDPEVMAVGHRVVEVLAECRGVVTVQCIVTQQRGIRVIEINPRFGGGVPLAIHAGADFPKWILQEHMGRRPRINPSGFRDDLVMLRYDDAVYVPNASRLARATKIKPLTRSHASH